jgi:NIMA (never in mitosis gene a)-related kinase
MSALQPPFNAQSLHQLARKIIVGKYPDVPAHFGQGIPNLLSALLNIDPDKRPNINQIL